METVIAKSKKGILLASYITIMVVGVLFLLFGGFAVIFGVEKSLRQLGVMFAVLGVVFTAIGLGWTIHLARLPKICLTFKDGKLRFYDGFECSPSEIISCSARCGWMDGAMYNWGRLSVFVGNKEYIFKYVENASFVESNINSLKAQFAAIEEVQKHIAERQATENADVTEENKEV